MRHLKKKFNKKRRLLIFAFHFMPHRGGIQTYSFELARHLQKAGFKLVVLAKSCPEDKAFDAQQAFKIIRMKGVGIRWIRVIPMALYFLFTVLRYRIRFVHCVNWIPCGFVAAPFRKLLFFRFLVSCHGGEITASLTGFRGLALRYTLRRAAWLIAGNNYVRERLNHLNLSRVPISVILFGVDSERFRPGQEISALTERYGTAGNTTLLTVAEFRKRKGIDTALKAIKLLKERGKKIRYLLVGRGEDESRLRELTNRYGLENEVVFTGPVPENELPLHYGLCDIYLMPNRETSANDIEGFGIVFIEANASGKPVIGGRSGGVIDSIVDGETGFLVNPLNEEEIAEKIDRLIQDKTLANEMGKNGRRRAMSLFSWEAIAHRTEMIYDAAHL